MFNLIYPFYKKVEGIETYEGNGMEYLTAKVKKYRSYLQIKKIQEKKICNLISEATIFYQMACQEFGVPDTSREFQFVNKLFDNSKKFSVCGGLLEVGVCGSYFEIALAPDASDVLDADEKQKEEMAPRQKLDSKWQREIWKDAKLDKIPFPA
eukprot:GHVP01029111.1.p1 GENE.GHVP01029111.1~~GHVP01029111.1.p1  ORF type:complete len:153 (-),score=36.43 GHVP01029111.1:372-830(-)